MCLCSYKLKFEEGAEIKPHIPLLNNRIYDNKFESQFYMISDTNKVGGLIFRTGLSYVLLMLFVSRHSFSFKQLIPSNYLKITTLEKRMFSFV